MAAFRKLALTVLVLAAFGCVATAGALSQPQEQRFSSAAPSLRVQVTPLRPLAGGVYAETVRVANRGSGPARLFITVRGGTGVVLRDAHAGQPLSPGAVRIVAVELRPSGSRIATRVTGSAL
jgi:hypothetical protein